MVNRCSDKSLIKIDFIIYLKKKWMKNIDSKKVHLKAFYILNRLFQCSLSWKKMSKYFEIFLFRSHVLNYKTKMTILKDA